VAKRANSSPPPKSSQHEEEPPAKKPKQEEEEEEVDTLSCDVSGGDLKVEDDSDEKLPEGSDEKQKISEEVSLKFVPTSNR